MFSFPRNLLRLLERNAMALEAMSDHLKRLTDVGDSVVTLLGGLRQEVHDLRTAGTDPTTAAAIQKLDGIIQSKTDEWAAAVVATPEDPLEPPVPEPITPPDVAPEPETVSTSRRTKN